MLEITYNSGNLIIGDGPEYVGLDEIIFYIPKQFYEYKMFTVLKQGTQLDTLELKQSNSTKRLYYNYRVEYYPVKLKNGNCEIQIFGINLTNGKSFFSNKIAIKIVNEDYNFKSSIYIMVDTLYYLKKGGRITPAAAALGTLLKLKPVLQIQGEKLDSFAKARTVKQAKSMMIEAMQNDFANRFHDPEGKNMYLEMAYTYDTEAAEAFKTEVQAAFPGMEIIMDPLSLSVSCHIGPGALAIACSKKIPELM